MGPVVNFSVFEENLCDYVEANMTYMCDLECELVGGIEKCVKTLILAV